MRFDRGKDVELEDVFDHIPIQKFSKRLTRFVNKILNADFIFDRSLVKVFVELVACAFFKRFESLFQRLVLSRNIGKAVSPINTIRRIQPYKRIIVRYFFSKLFKIAIKYVWHPVPAWAHVKRKSISLQLLGSAAGHRVFFHNSHLPSCLGHKSGR